MKGIIFALSMSCLLIGGSMTAFAGSRRCSEYRRIGCNGVYSAYYRRILQGRLGHCSRRDRACRQGHNPNPSQSCNLQRVRCQSEARRFADRVARGQNRRCNMTCRRVCTAPSWGTTTCRF